MMIRNAALTLLIMFITLWGCTTKKEENSVSPEKKSPIVAEEEISALSAKSVTDILITTEELSALIGKEDLVIIDARDADQYIKLHIPGAVNIPKDTFREPEDLDYKSENGFLISPEKAARVFGTAGIDENARVIVYGTNKFPNATIPFAILKQFGHENVQVLKGEIEKWIKERRPLTDRVPEVKPKIFKADPKSELAADKDWIMDNAEEIVVIDMRSFEEYTGYDTAGLPREGHVAGAFPVEWKELAGKSTIKSLDEMMKVLKNNGVPIEKDKEYVTYCNWGIGRGTSGYLYLKALGFEKVRIYGGSMEDWSDDEDYPVSTYDLGVLE